MADPLKRYRSNKGLTYIDLKLRHISQLFDSRDPSPFLERDIDDDAVDYIVNSTMEHSLGTPIAIVIYISDTDSFTLDPRIVIESVHNHFTYNAEMMRKKLSRTLRQGQFTFLIGVVVLFICLSIAQTLNPNKDYPYIGVLREGMVIMGWVAMWRPIDTFLYSWWPQFEMRRVFMKLSHVPIEVKLQARAP